VCVCGSLVLKAKRKEDGEAAVEAAEGGKAADYKGSAKVVDYRLQDDKVSMISTSFGNGRKI